MKLFAWNFIRMVIALVSLSITYYLMNRFVWDEGVLLTSSSLGVYAFIMYFMGEKKLVIDLRDPKKRGVIKTVHGDLEIVEITNSFDVNGREIIIRAIDKMEWRKI